MSQDELFDNNKIIKDAESLARVVNDMLINTAFLVNESGLSIDPILITGFQLGLRKATRRRDIETSPITKKDITVGIKYICEDMMIDNSYSKVTTLENIYFSYEDAFNALKQLRYKQYIEDMHKIDKLQVERAKQATGVLKVGEKDKC